MKLCKLIEVLPPEAKFGSISVILFLTPMISNMPYTIRKDLGLWARAFLKEQPGNSVSKTRKNANSGKRMHISYMPFGTGDRAQAIISSSAHALGYPSIGIMCL